MTLYLGRVSCDLHKLATRVRVAVFGTDGIPLAVKASFGNYPRKLFEKGVAVELEQCRHDGRHFRITAVFKAVERWPEDVVIDLDLKPVKHTRNNIVEGRDYRAKVYSVSPLNGYRYDVGQTNIGVLRCNIADANGTPLAIKVYWNRKTHGQRVPEVGHTLLVYAYRNHPCDHMRFKPTFSATGKDETMATSTSKECVRFHIGDRYFRFPSVKIAMGKVMARAFDMSAKVADGWLHGGGVWITCRPSQFARFLIYRNKADITNGFMDLKAELVKPVFKDFYTRLSALTGVGRDDIKQVILALNFSVPMLEHQISRAEDGKINELDVSQNSKFV